MADLFRDPFVETVDGFIIGPVTFPYEFHVYEPRPEYQDKRGIPRHKIAWGHFENDTQAVEWFKNNYPAKFKKGNVEMRVFDREKQNVLDCISTFGWRGVGSDCAADPDYFVVRPECTKITI